MSEEYYCPKCENKDPIPASADRCPACQHELPCPNVRAASAQEETEALAARVKTAYEDAKARNCEDILAAFGRAVATSSAAAICRPLGEIKRLVASSTALYGNFYKECSGGIRVPEGNEFDNVRGAVDEVMFPGYRDNIYFAALTLNGHGPTPYGPHSIVLKGSMIAHRASVFETNTLVFFRKRRLPTTDPVPPGYRAVWEERGVLSQAKLHHKIDSDTSATDFANILICEGETTDTAEFIEVHLYQTFNRYGIERIVFGGATCKADRLIIKSLKKTLDELGIEHEGP